MTSEQHNHLEWGERIDAAARFIESNLDNDYSIDEVARVAHYSLFHFHRLFRARTGESVSRYAKRLRMERAAYRLAHGSNESPTDDLLTVAVEAGYSSHEAFTRAFRAMFGVTPSAYRTQQNHSQKEVSDMADELTVRVETMEPVTVAAVRHVGGYDTVGDTWKTLMKWGWTKVLFGKALTLGMCHDDPDITPADKLRYDACLVVKGSPKVKGNVRLDTIRGGSYAVTEHAGSYGRLGETYAKLCARIVSAPIEGISWALAEPPSVERYLNDPRKTKEDALRTEVWFPIVRAS